MSSVISVENVSKTYRLGMIGGATLKEDLARWWAKTRGKADPSLKIGEEHHARTIGKQFWALQDINFQVEEGEVLGIIGRNGAGKSTLLKILSQVTAPTSGEIKVKGRIASLLEVGTGFHPELSGRENVFLNGAILGMTKREIRNKFDEIVAFSGIEEFIDTPVKRYSSGMYVRLAFAVAAHLEPEILIVDEVLAVGDVAFQDKCLGKMKDVSRHGRTVLFVSHQMGSVRQLCTRAIQLVDGSVAFAGSAEQAIERYLGATAPAASGRFIAESSSKKQDIAIESAECIDAHGTIKGRFTHDESITVVIKCRVNRWVGGSEIRMALKDGSLRAIFTEDAKLEKLQNGDSDLVEVRATIPATFLRPGSYRLTFATFVPDVIILDLVEDVISISVIDGGSKYAKSEGLDYGCVFAPCTWSVRYVKRPSATLDNNYDQCRP